VQKAQRRKRSIEPQRHAITAKCNELCSEMGPEAARCMQDIIHDALCTRKPRGRAADAKRDRSNAPSQHSRLRSASPSHFYTSFSSLLYIQNTLYILAVCLFLPPTACLCGCRPLSLPSSTMSGSSLPPSSSPSSSDSASRRASPHAALAFLVHSPNTVANHLPPDVDNRPLARQKRRRTRYAIPLFVDRSSVFVVRDASRPSTPALVRPCTCSPGPAPHNLTAFANHPTPAARKTRRF
jgi:hypothetical protein